MSSKPLQNSKLLLEETTQEYVAQMYPHAWRSDAREKEALDFVRVRPEGAHCNSQWNRRRMWSSLSYRFLHQSIDFCTVFVG
jgi:hypothetical protein